MINKDSAQILAAKKIAGQTAAEFIENGMVVGLGTGSTALFFIEALGAKCRQGLKIFAVATSQKSMHYAQRLNIPLKDPEEITSIDIIIDGADEIDQQKNMIKGGGGALLREKLLAQSSREMVVIVDETKIVDHLGRAPLPVEIARFIYLGTIQRIKSKGYRGTLRLTEQNLPYLTDNGNYIFDIQFDAPVTDPIIEQEHLKSITGVLETGFFVQIAGRVVVGYENGLSKVWK